VEVVRVESLGAKVRKKEGENDGEGSKSYYSESQIQKFC
jgi:hypothetical protein